MPIYLQVKLTEGEKKELLKLKQAVSTPERTRSRIETLTLSDRGFSVKQIATLTGQKESTIRKTLGRWMVRGQEGLFDQPRKGRPRRWEEEDIKYLESCLQSEPRTYNSYQLAEKLKEERKIELSPQTLRKVLKKKDYRWKRTLGSLKGKRQEQEFLKKKSELETLKRYEEEGYIQLKYLDEAGLSLWSPVSYSYVKKGEQKAINQTKKRGKRLNILGIWKDKESFEYGLKLGQFKSKSYIEIIEWQANKAEDNFRKTGQLTVIVLDSYAVHKSKEVKKNLERWRKKGLEFFFISAYSPELNLVEPEWHQLKTYEIAGRMFENEYDLAMAVIKGIESRSQKNYCVCERFRFH